MVEVAGLVLAAGAGSRMGRPKALVADPDGTPWLPRAVDVLRGGGCSEVAVVLGAGADEARGLVPDGVRVVVADDWAEGMGASLRAGLRALLEHSAASAALMTLVDLPDVTGVVARRVLELGAAPDVLGRATFAGRPGHPVLLGREHWAAIAAEVEGDSGARHYLERHDAVPVPCGDLATGRDQDGPTRDQRGHP